jgi:hypothetical protein
MNLKDFAANKDGLYNTVSLQAELNDLYEQSEADAAFRASIDELCKQNGMPERGSSVLHVANNLCKINDRLAMNDIAQVCSDYNIPDDMTPSEFIADQCEAVYRLEEQLAGVQHRLAELEQHGDPWKALDNVRQALSSKIDFYQSALSKKITDVDRDVQMRISEQGQYATSWLNRIYNEHLTAGQAVALTIFTVVVTTGATVWIQGLFN